MKILAALFIFTGPLYAQSSVSYVWQVSATNAAQIEHIANVTNLAANLVTTMPLPGVVTTTAMATVPDTSCTIYFYTNGKLTLVKTNQSAVNLKNDY